MSALAETLRTFDDPPRAIPPQRVTELMLELLDLQPTDKLMEIGTGSGTQTAIWASRVKELHTLELRQFTTCDYLGNHVYMREADGKDGIPSEAPFDAIIATCGVKDIFPAWTQQLADGGRLVVPIGDSSLQRLTRFVKHGESLQADKIAGYCRFSMMEKR